MEAKDEEFEVEKIVARRDHHGKTQYRVRWLGYGADQDTWEPIENLSSCKSLVDECNEKHKRRSAGKKCSRTKRRGRKGKANFVLLSSSDEEADTVKDKFWQLLDQGQIPLPEGDLYSNVKTTHRSMFPVQYSGDDGKVGSNESDDSYSKAFRKKRRTRSSFQESGIAEKTEGDTGSSFSESEQLPDLSPRPSPVPFGDSSTPTSKHSFGDSKTKKNGPSDQYHMSKDVGKDLPLLTPSSDLRTNRQAKSSDDRLESSSSDAQLRSQQAVKDRMKSFPIFTDCQLRFVDGENTSDSTSSGAVTDSKNRLPKEVTDSGKKDVRKSSSLSRHPLQSERTRESGLTNSKTLKAESSLARAESSFLKDVFADKNREHVARDKRLRQFGDGDNAKGRLGVDSEKRLREEKSRNERRHSSAGVMPKMSDSPKTADSAVNRREDAIVNLKKRKIENADLNRSSSDSTSKEKANLKFLPTDGKANVESGKPNGGDSVKVCIKTDANRSAFSMSNPLNKNSMMPSGSFSVFRCPMILKSSDQCRKSSGASSSASAVLSSNRDRKMDENTNQNKTEKSRDRKLEGSGGRTGELNRDRKTGGNEKQIVKGNELHKVERSKDQKADGNKDRRTDGSKDQMTERNGIQKAERKIDQNADRSKNQTTETSKDKMADGSKDRQMDRNRDRKTEASIDQKTDENKDRKADGNRDRRSDANKDRKDEAGKDRKADGNKDQKVERAVKGEKDRKTDVNKDHKAEGNKDKRVEESKNRSVEGSKDRKVHGQSGAVEGNEKRKAEHSNDKKHEISKCRTVEGKEVGKVVGNDDRRIKENKAQKVESKDRKGKEDKDQKKMEGNSDHKIIESKDLVVNMDRKAAEARDSKVLRNTDTKGEREKHSNVLESSNQNSEGDKVKLLKHHHHEEGTMRKHDGEGDSGNVHKESWRDCKNLSRDDLNRGVNLESRPKITLKIFAPADVSRDICYSDAVPRSMIQAATKTDLKSNESTVENSKSETLSDSQNKVPIGSAQNSEVEFGVENRRRTLLTKPSVSESNLATEVSTEGDFHRNSDNRRPIFNVTELHNAADKGPNILVKPAAGVEFGKGGIAPSMNLTEDDSAKDKKTSSYAACSELLKFRISKKQSEQWHVVAGGSEKRKLERVESADEDENVPLVKLLRLESESSVSSAKLRKTDSVFESVGKKRVSEKLRDVECSEDSGLEANKAVKKSLFSGRVKRSVSAEEIVGKIGDMCKNKPSVGTGSNLFENFSVQKLMPQSTTVCQNSSSKTNDDERKSVSLNRNRRAASCDRVMKDFSLDEVIMNLGMNQTDIVDLLRGATTSLDSTRYASSDGADARNVSFSSASPLKESIDVAKCKRDSKKTAHGTLHNIMTVKNLRKILQKPDSLTKLQGHNKLQNIATTKKPRKNASEPDLVTVLHLNADIFHRANATPRKGVKSANSVEINKEAADGRREVRKRSLKDLANLKEKPSQSGAQFSAALGDHNYQTVIPDAFQGNNALLPCCQKAQMTRFEITQLHEMLAKPQIQKVAETFSCGSSKTGLFNADDKMKNLTSSTYAGISKPSSHLKPFSESNVDVLRKMMNDLVLGTNSRDACQGDVNKSDVNQENLQNIDRHSLLKDTDPDFVSLTNDRGRFFSSDCIQSEVMEDVKLQDGETDIGQSRTSSTTINLKKPANLLNSDATLHDPYGIRNSFHDECQSGKGKTSGSCSLAFCNSTYVNTQTADASKDLICPTDLKDGAQGSQSLCVREFEGKQEILDSYESTMQPVEMNKGGVNKLEDELIRDVILAEGVVNKQEGAVNLDVIRAEIDASKRNDEVNQNRILAKSGASQQEFDVNLNIILTSENSEQRSDSKADVSVKCDLDGVHESTVAGLRGTPIKDTKQVPTTAMLSNSSRDLSEEKAAGEKSSELNSLLGEVIATKPSGTSSETSVQAGRVGDFGRGAGEEVKILLHKVSDSSGTVVAVCRLEDHVKSVNGLTDASDVRRPDCSPMDLSGSEDSRGTLSCVTTSEDKITSGKYIPVNHPLINVAALGLDIRKLERGQPPNLETFTNSDLSKAVFGNDMTLLRFALEKENGSWNLEQTDESGQTLVMAAVRNRNCFLVKLLVERGAAISAKAKDGTTALMIAAEMGLLKMVRMLIYFGARCDDRASNGETALIKAAKGGHYFVVHDLLNCGANFSPLHPDNIDVLQVARPDDNMRSLVMTHIQNLEFDFDGRVAAAIKNVGKLVRPLFPLHCLTVKQMRIFTMSFNHKTSQPRDRSFIPMLFIGHALVGYCSMACLLKVNNYAVKCVSLNGRRQKFVEKDEPFCVMLVPLFDGLNRLVISLKDWADPKMKLVLRAYEVLPLV